MSDDWTEVDTVTDATGKRVSVGYWGGWVRFAILSPAGVVLTQIVLNGDGRERHDKAYATASWQAEAHDEALVTVIPDDPAVIASYDDDPYGNDVIGGER